MSADFSTVRHIKARPEALAISLRNYQSELSPDERLTLWEALRQGYCTDCACVLETGEKCHCSSAIAPCDPVELNPGRMSEMIARQYDAAPEICNGICMGDPSDCDPNEHHPRCNYGNWLAAQSEARK